jgi:hypothetical protein
MKTALLAVAALAASVIPALACDELGEMRRALAQAQTQAADHHRERAEAALARAEAARDVIDSYLSLVYFPGLFTMRDDVVEVTAQDTPGYRALSAEAAFLRGAAGAKISLQPADRAAQFVTLKGSFESALREAVVEMRALGGDAKLDRRVHYLAEWGVESQVCAVGLKSCEQVLTRTRRDVVFASPYEPNDPRE